jgi:hypothetical protein
MKGEANKFPWEVSRNYFDGRGLWHVWRQTRALEPGEPMHGGVREARPGLFETEGEARSCADALNAAEAEEALK